MSVLASSLAEVLAVFVPIAPPADGPAVYRENCAACHGKEGHGDGPTAKELKYKPRDFREGKFAFGNTPGAMAKTVMSGIPGEETARMPAFKSVLEPADIDAVVAYVRTMMPVEPAPTATDMKMEPRDGALMVRGILAPLKEGDPPIPRGLLFGLPSGFSFEYATESLRLLAVRRGEFVTRSDWEERGGRPLTPLGSVVIAAAQPKEWAPFVLESGDGNGALRFAPLAAKLRSSSVAHGVVELDYDVGKNLHVRERPRDVVVSDGAGIVQELEFTPTRQQSILFSIALASDPSLPLPKSGEPSHEGALGQHASDQLEVARATGWYIVRSSPTATVAVRFDLPEKSGASVSARTMPEWDVIDVSLPLQDKPLTVRRTIVARSVTTIEQLEKMTKELK